MGNRGERERERERERLDWAIIQQEVITGPGVCAQQTEHEREQSR